MKFVRSAWFQIGGVMLLAAAWKALFLFWAVVPFNADEAVVALMARHILLGERPVFFYGQAYMGSLDAFLVAGGFVLFGQQVWVIHLVQGLLYLGTVFTTLWIGKEAFNSLSTGIIAALLLAIPTVNLNLYTTASLGGYGEALLLGSLILYVALMLARRYISGDSRQSPLGLFGLWGLLVGVGLWANGLTLVYSAPAGIYLLWALWKCRRQWIIRFFLLAGLGFFLGSLPWWVFAAANGPTQLITELLGKAISVERTPWFVRTGNHLINFLLIGSTALFGFRPPWAVRWLALPLLPLILIFWLAVVVFGFRKSTQKNAYQSAYALLAGVGVVLLSGFLFTSFGADPSGRYFLPLSVPLALIAAQMILSAPKLKFAPPRWIAGGLAACILVFQLWGNLECALTFPPGLTTQFDSATIIDHRADGELMTFLRANGEKAGYSNYWVSYPLAFQSREELIFIPRLPYHTDMRYTPRDDRYAPYTEYVSQSERVAYITARSPLLDDYLRAHFSMLQVTWEEHQIADYHIFYRLSRPVRPQEINLGEPRE